MEFEWAEHVLMESVRWLRLLIEAAGVLVIAVGAVMALRSAWAPVCPPGADRFLCIRLTLARYLALALEFQLAADVLSTVLSPTWEDLGKLAAIAAIRTTLNHFLAKESRELSDGVGVLAR
ncbi:DUF1622 domain-containing protein [Ideonella sp.]|jgi:uncharacterized membrane protein|uniref:DUF1622 domain-containing protein n=1 Tax=Ideonella sp. TaxID=1929293 RepID=UPI0037BEA99B